MWQPAHDDLVAPNDLLAVYAHVLPLLERTTGDDEGPCDQGSGIPRPAGLNWQLTEIDIIMQDFILLARRPADNFGRHIQYLFENRQLVPGIPKTFGNFRLSQRRQQFADIAQRRDRIFAHPQGHPPGRTEQIRQYRDLVPRGFVEYQRRALPDECPMADFGHFQVRINLDINVFEFALLFKLMDEIAQIPVFHRSDPV